MVHQILIVDDDPVICDLLEVFLGRRTDFELLFASNGKEAIQIFERDVNNVSLILLDLMMPEMDGWETLRAIRELGDTPVIMITAMDGAQDIIKAFTLGVDDYVTKPFNLSIVEARIEAVLRRGQRTVESPKVLIAGPLTINPGPKNVMLREEPLQLSPKEYQLVELLAQRSGETVSPKMILDRLWPNRHWATAQDVKQLVYLLRQKVEDDPSDPNIIVTVRGFGYMMRTD